MGAQNFLRSFLLCALVLFVIGTQAAQGYSDHHNHHDHVAWPTKLFVFGDSYADTGNNRGGTAFKKPYGITFPGKPSGRYSDGRVFTDFLARSLRLKTPLAYSWRKYKSAHLNYGMNFAFGGTGVFDTSAPYPNMTTQIDLFQQLIKESVFTSRDLHSSVAHVSLVGNDYAAFLTKSGGSFVGIQTFVSKVVDQLIVDIQRIYNLGVKRISVTGLQPLGCLPQITFQTSFQQCNSTFNKLTTFHNLLLQQAVSKLNIKISNSESSPFIVIDLFNAFLSVIKEKGAPQGNLIFDNPLQPCCSGINETYFCGDVDANGNKMYTVCKDPKSYLFWDIDHPTQAGWEALTYKLQPTIQQLLR